MKQEEKDLLLRDLCARLPYGVLISTPIGDGHLNSINQTIFWIELGINVNPTKRDKFDISHCLPYLRPMSSMTEEESKRVTELLEPVDKHHYISPNNFSDVIDFFNSIHLDFRNLIDKGLALEAPEGIYTK